MFERGIHEEDVELTLARGIIVEQNTMRISHCQVFC
ncbi:MAG: hypothetical protein GX422_02555 [Deltaproteobacteria bacterium]|nr:hypothetical protein [Deltaproteobacteria bacterium]